MPRKKRVEDLTEAQERLMRTIAKLPGCSLQEIGDKLELTYGTVVYHIRNLKHKGYLTTIPGKARTTRLTTKAQKALGLEAAK